MCQVLLFFYELLSSRSDNVLFINEISISDITVRFVSFNVHEIYSTVAEQFNFIYKQLQ